MSSRRVVLFLWLALFVLGPACDGDSLGSLAPTYQTMVDPSDGPSHMCDGFFAVLVSKDNEAETRGVLGATCPGFSDVPSFQIHLSRAGANLLATGETLTEDLPTTIVYTSDGGDLLYRPVVRARVRDLSLLLELGTAAGGDGSAAAAAELQASGSWDAYCADATTLDRLETANGGPCESVVASFGLGDVLTFVPNTNAEF